jgi:hypothetical protein
MNIIIGNLEGIETEVIDIEGIPPYDINLEDVVY